MSESGEIPNNSKFTRRDFLKLSGLAIASLALKPKLSEEPPKKQFGKETQEIETHKGYQKETLQIGNLSLTAILVEHGEKDWRSHGQEILNELKPFSLVIPEYFPPEYIHLEENPLMKPGLSFYQKQNVLFDHIANYALINNKEIRVLDPAYSLLGIAFAYGVSGSKSKREPSPPEIKPTKNEGQPKDKSLNLKKLLRWGIATGALAGGTTRLAFDKNMFEQDLRRVLVAQALIQLGETLPPETRALIIYPPAHWYGRTKETPGWDSATGIKEYLTNNDRRKFALSLYRGLKNKKTFGPLFATRHYRSKNSRWEKLPGFIIET